MAGIIRGAADRSWEYRDGKDASDPNAVFTINDIELVIPPTQISVRKEDMYWQWNTLRSRVSTKVPSGHGLVQVSLNIIFTPDMLLSLHRLIVQFKHSPFCWIENDYLRETIVPRWEVWQQMAFTMSSINVSPMKGTPGTFACEIDLRWFNYAPYAVNFLFRREWATESIKVPSAGSKGSSSSAVTDTVRYSIPVWIGPFIESMVGHEKEANSWYTEKSEDEGREKGWLPTIIRGVEGFSNFNQSQYRAGEEGPRQEDPARETFSVVLEAIERSSSKTMTLHDMERTHAGRVFDLLPLPSRMQASAWVVTPALSNIYVRFINSLQAKSLYDNFGIDVYQDIFEFPGGSTTGAGLLYKSVASFTSMDEATGYVTGLHTGGVPPVLRQRWVSTFLSTMKRTIFHYEDYRTLNLTPDIIAKLSDAQKKLQEAAVETQSKERTGATSSLPAIEIRGQHKRRTYAPGEGRHTRLSQWRRKDMHKLILHRPCLVDDDPNAFRLSDHFSWRWDHPAAHVQRPHEGIDIPIPEGTPIYAVEDGTVVSATGSVLYILHSDLNMTSVYRHLSKTDVNKGAVVTRGQPIGLSGTYGTGAHLHFELQENTSEMPFNPVPWLNARDGQTPNTQYMQDVIQGMTSEDQKLAKKNAPYPSSSTTSTPTTADPELGEAAAITVVEPDGQEETLLTEDQLDSIGLTQEEAEGILNDYKDLANLGFMYYDARSDVVNVWRRTITLSILTGNDDLDWSDVSGTEEYGALNTKKILLRDGAVLIGVAGGMRHNIASIPILGSEFPTHQHLGSTEPSYMMEFALIDDKLTGIPLPGRSMEEMRQKLQHNARAFRPVLDGHALCTDNFITRLFGTYSDSDYKINESNQSALRKRSCITRATCETKEGNPGLSSMVFEVSETNPYVQEEIIAVPTASPDIDDRRKKVLHALANLELTEEGIAALLLQNANEVQFEFDSENMPEQLMRGRMDAGISERYASRVAVFDQDISVTGQDKFYSQLFGETALKQVNMFEAVGAAPFIRADGSDSFMMTEKEIRTSFGDEAFERAKQYQVPGRGADLYDVGNSDAGIRELIQDTEQDAYVINKSIMADYLDRTGGDLTSDIELTTAQLEAAGYIDPVDPLGTPRAALSLGGIDQAHSMAESARIIKDIESRAIKATLVDASFVDVTQFHYANPRLQDVDIEIVRHYHAFLLGLIQEANCLVSEPNVPGAVTEEHFKEQLYNLPNLEQEMWQRFGYWMYAYVKWRYGDWLKADSVGAWLSKNLGAYAPAEIKSLGVNPWSTQAEFKARLDDGLGFGYVGIKHTTSVVMSGPWRGIKRIAFGAIDNTALAVDSAVNFLTPMESRRGDGSQWQQILRRNDKPTMFDHFIGSIDSDGSTDVPFWAGEGTTTIDNNRKEAEADVETVVQLYINDIMPLHDQILMSASDTILAPFKKFIESVEDTSFLGFKGHLAALAWWSLPPRYLQSEGSVEQGNYTYQRTTLPPIKTSIQYEENKIKKIRSGLVDLADRLLSNMPLLSLFGLEELATTDLSGGVANWSGIQCYPDMDLPAHPYYPDRLHATNPDFYMWSIYEDAPGAVSAAIVEDLQDNLAAQINGSYDHLKKMQGSGIRSKDDKGLTTGATAQSPIMSALVHHPTGTDDVDSLTKIGGRWDYLKEAELNPMEVAFWDPDSFVQRSANVEKQIKKLSEQIKNMPRGTKEQEKARDNAKTVLARLKTISTEGGLKPLIPYLSLTDGILGSDQARVDANVYRDLVQKVAKSEAMFGSKAGYLGEYLTDETATNTVDSVEDTRLAAMDTYTHAFDPESLKNLTNDSAHDIISEKLTLRRAYPTFKLMLIEEDELNSRLLNFDDFYTYNGVKEFTVVQSRESAADTATIVLQNVSGSLDGTKREAVVDLDYFDRERAAKIKELNDSTQAHNNVPEVEDGRHQPFSAVVMRPGMNIQLRAGYSNDPNMLEVLISGRVVDVMWNSQGDLCELTVQSFGVELTADIKGRNDGRYGENDEALVFETTHKLLSSMMLQPEVLHFGRWKIGQLFQYGESKDARLDFVDYSEKDFWGWFSFTGKMMKFMKTHPVISTGIAIGIAALSITPMGRAGAAAGASKGIVSRLMGGAAAKIGGGSTWGGFAGKNLAVTAKGINQRIGAAIGMAKGGSRGSVVNKFLHSGGVSSESIRKAGLRPLLTKLAGTTTKAEKTAVFAEIETAFTTLAKSETSRVRGLVLGYSGANLGGLTFFQGAQQIAGSGFNIFGRVLAINSRAFLAATAASIGLQAAADVLGWGYDITIGEVKRNYTRKKASLFLSPQDDNLYPPNPKDYMTLEFEFWEWSTIKRLGAVVAGGFAGALMGVPGTADKVGEWYDAWTQPDKWQTNKQLLPSECLYQVQNSTIWDLFHEMSLRHPGWIYGPRPYGTSLRYTMFFGVPGQRYWSKPATNNFVDRMNTLREHLEDGNINRDIYEKLYGAVALKKIEDAFSFEIKERIDSSSSLPESYVELGESFNPFNPNNIEDISDVDGNFQSYVKKPESYAASASLDHLNLRFTNEVMEEYLKGLENRFVPFRRYHMLRSETDIVSNNIMGSEHNVVNAVSVLYHDRDRLVSKTLPMKASSFIKEPDLNVLPVSFSNVIGKKAAMRYGMSSLMYGLKKMYRGELLVLGNPRIKPWDICYLLDDYNDMFGPIEVEQVVHMFSYETGFLTEIKPNAVVFANEISTWPVLEGLKLYCMAVRDKEQGTGTVGPDGIPRDGGGSSHWWESAVTDPDYKARLAKKYGGIFQEGFDFEEFMSEMLPDDPDITGGFTEGRLPGHNMASLTAALLVGGVTTGLAFGTRGLASAALGKVGISAANGIWSSRIAKAIGIGGTAKGGTWAWNKLDNVFNNLGASWLVAGPILFAKCLQEETVAVVPLTKGGRPIVSGLQQGDPMAIWRNIFGDVTNIIDDTMWGIDDVTREWTAWKDAIWRTPWTGLRANRMTGIPE